MKKSLILVSTVIIAMFASCTKETIVTKEFWIDNPLDKEITISIDNETYTIPAVSGIKADIELGKHKLTYENSSVNFIAKSCDQNVVLNPTLSNYIFHHEFYTDKENELKAEEEIEKIVSAYLYDFDFGEDNVYKAPFKVVNSLFIERYEYYWHYGLDTPYPAITSILENSTNLSTVVKSKLFREADFMEYAKDMFEDDYKFPSPAIRKLEDLKPFVLVPDLHFDCDKAAPIADIINKKVDSLSIVSGREFKDLFYRISRIPYDGTFPAELRKECDDTNYTLNMVTVGKAIESLGAKSGLIVR